MSITLAGMELKGPVMNAAGTCKTIEDVERLLSAEVSAVVVGSITVSMRPGNAGTTYWFGSFHALNSRGLPNPGFEDYRRMLPDMVHLAHLRGKKLIVSVAGLKPGEWRQLTEMSYEAGADLVELNLGCPNVWGDSGQKRIVCFDPHMVAAVLEEVESVASERGVAVKISPFSDPFGLEELAGLLKTRKIVKVVTTSNTFPNGFGVNDAGKPLITATGTNGLAGVSGKALKPIAMGQVRQLVALLPPTIQVIGVGGIETGRDVYDYLQAGATAVQIGTAFAARGGGVFDTVANQMCAENVWRAVAASA